MRFALLGDHPDGLDMARALVASGRHELIAYTGHPASVQSLQRWGLTAKAIRDVEEILADPSVEAAVVASRAADRPAHLRRALQSEHHVLCVHPADQSPESAYEAALIQGDTRRVLLPLLPEALHPAFARLAELIQAEEGVLGALQILEVERGSADALCREGRATGHKLSIRGWDVLRILGGEVAEVFAFSTGEELAAEEPLLLLGRFERRGLFQETLLPGPEEARWQVVVVGSYGRAELTFPQGWPGPAYLVWRDQRGEVCEERWESWNPWPALVQIFETAVADWAEGERGCVSAPSLGALTQPRSPGTRAPLSWQTAVRCLELDDAARRSLERRRLSTLEYPEATEEVGFKGTMTLVGCSLLWVSLLLLILSAWISWLKWTIVPLLVAFLVLQLLRWIVPPSRESERRAQA
jgi:predicted dehydrogenase